MTDQAISMNRKYETETKPVDIGAAVLLVYVIFLLTISGSGIADLMGYQQKIDTRVPTFLLRMLFLLTALAAAFVIFTNTSTYKRKRVAYAPWMFLSVGLVFFLIYVIIPIFQSISYSLTRWNGLYDINGICPVV